MYSIFYNLIYLTSNKYKENYSSSYTDELCHNLNISKSKYNLIKTKQIINQLRINKILNSNSYKDDKIDLDNNKRGK